MEVQNQILSLIRSGAIQQTSDSDFNDLALALFHYQFERNIPARRFWVGQNVSPTTISNWSQIPPVPQSAFKYLTLTTFDPAFAVHTFRTSGTTDDVRGTHYLSSAIYYQSASLTSFSRHVLPDGAQLPMLALVPDSHEAPDSSLSTMAGFVEHALCGRHGATYWMKKEVLDHQGLILALEQWARIKQPVLLYGTTFAFVHLVDHMADQHVRLLLPPGSRIMETGGLKGKSRTISRDALLHLLEHRLGVPPHNVINEYGMTELSSQLYLDTMSNPNATTSRWVAPPWMRIRVLDPVSLKEVPLGEVGVIALYDLANIDSVFAILTSDFGRQYEDMRVDILGRGPAIDRRGCAWAVDTVLGAHTPSGATSTRSKNSPVGDSRAVDTILPLTVSLRHAQKSLRGRTPRDIALILGTLSQRWLDPDDVYRKRALSELSANTGIHPTIVALGLDRSFSQWTQSALLELLAHQPQSSPSNIRVTPAVTLIVAASNVPTPVAFDIYTTLLVQSAVLVKTPSFDDGFARIFAESLTNLDPMLGHCLAISSWVGGDIAVETAIAPHIDAVIANGTDDAVSDLRTRFPLSIPFLARGTRHSVVLVDCEALNRQNLALWATNVALDVVLWDQRGCLSPSIVYVRPSERISVADIGHALDVALSQWDQRAPCGPELPESAAYARSARDSAAMAALAGQPVSVLSHVVIDERERRPERLGGRRLWVVPFDPFQALTIGALRLSTVVLTAPLHRRAEWIQLGIAAGVSRFCDPGFAQSPPARWHHDGVEPLAGLVRWADVETDQ